MPLSRSARTVNRTWTTLVAVVCLFGLAACGSSDEGGNSASQPLKVCTDSPYEPFEFEDPDSPSGYSGFEIDLIQAVADQMGRKIEVKDMGFDGIQSGAALKSGQCEVAAASLYVTPERKKSLAFSDSFYSTDLSLLVPAGSSITSLEGVSGKKIAVQQGSVGAKYLETTAPDDTHAVSYPGDAEMWLALKSGSVDAVFQDNIVATRHENADERYKIANTYPNSGADLAFAVDKEGSHALLEKINKNLQKLRDDGTYKKLEKKYFQ